MKRRSFINHAGLAGVLAAGAAPAIVHAQTTIRWRLASSFPKSLDTIYGAAETFTKSISDMSGGKFQISVHAGGGVQRGAATFSVCYATPEHLERTAVGCLRGCPRTP